EIDRGRGAPMATKELSHDPLDPVARDGGAVLARGGDAQAGGRGGAPPRGQHEGGTGHARSALADGEEALSGGQARGTGKPAVGAARDVRARDACAPSRDAGTGQGALPCCSSARGNRASSCDGDCSAGMCASWGLVLANRRTKALSVRRGK